MGWPFDEASWNNVAGAYHSAQGTEFLWILIALGMCGAALFFGSVHELLAYRRMRKD